MKKLAILFLLTTVLVAFTFGQVSVKGEFGLNNLGATKKAPFGTHDGDGDMNPFFLLQFDAASSKELGPGTFGLDFHVGQRVNFASWKSGSGHEFDGDNFATFSYALAGIGPGTLKPFVETNISTYLKPGAEYSGLEAGPVTLGFGGFLKYTYSGTAGGDKAQVFGTEDGGHILGIYVILNALDDKLFVKYEFDYGIGNKAGEKKAKYDAVAGKENDSGVAKIAYLDANYKITNEFTAGLELDNTHDSFWGFQVKPYASYKLNDHVDLGAYFKLYNILGDEDLGGKTIGFTPGIWAKYTF